MHLLWNCPQMSWLSLDLTADKSTLVQVMAWCHQAASHYLSQCWPTFMSPYGISRPQWIKLINNLVKHYRFYVGHKNSAKFSNKNSNCMWWQSTAEVAIDQRKDQRRIPIRVLVGPADMGCSVVPCANHLVVRSAWPKNQYNRFYGFTN